MAVSPKHSRSAAWSVLEYVAYPLALLAATPVLVRALGTEGFGLWTIVLALVGLGTVANLGMATAVVRFVSDRRGADDPAGAAAAVRQALAVAGLASGAVAALVALAGAGADDWFAHAGEPLAPLLLLTAGLLFLQQIEAVLAGALKGYERFDVAAPIEIASKLALVGAAVAAAAATNRVAPMVAAAVVIAAFGILVRGFAAGRIARARLWWPAAPAAVERDLLSFGAWTCLQGLAGVLLTHVDKLLVAWFLGATAVTYFAVCTQLAQQVHMLPAAALAFLLPLAGRRARTGEQRSPRRALLAGASLTLLLAIGLFALGDPFMRLWMGSAFATEAAALLPWLTLAYLILGMNVAPHYLLLGRGEARFVSLTNVAGGLASTLGALVLIPQLGLVGGAIARGLYGPVLLVSYARLWQPRRTGA